MLLDLGSTAVRRVEVILDAVGNNTDEDDPAPHETRVDSPGEQSRQVDDRGRSRGVLEIEQELIPASVGRGIAAIVGLERPYGYSSQAEVSGVRRIGLRRHAFGLQMQERQSQRERIERRLAVVQEYQPSADSPPG